MRQSCGQWNCCGDPKGTGEMHKIAEDKDITLTITHTERETHIHAHTHLHTHTQRLKDDFIPCVFLHHVQQTVDSASSDLKFFNQSTSICCLYCLITLSYCLFVWFFFHQKKPTNALVDRVTSLFNPLERLIKANPKERKRKQVSEIHTGLDKYCSW